VSQLVGLGLAASGTAGIAARHFQLVAYNLVVGLIYMEKYFKKMFQFFFGYMRIKNFFEFFLYGDFGHFSKFLSKFFSLYVTLFG